MSTADPRPGRLARLVPALDWLAHYGGPGCGATWSPR